MSSFGIGQGLAQGVNTATNILLKKKELDYRYAYLASLEGWRAGLRGDDEEVPSFTPSTSGVNAPAGPTLNLRPIGNVQAQRLGTPSPVPVAPDVSRGVLLANAPRATPTTGRMGPRGLNTALDSRAAMLGGVDSWRRRMRRY